MMIWFATIGKRSMKTASRSSLISLFKVLSTKRELNLVLVMRDVGLSVLRTLKREIRKLISKKPKNLNETKARTIHERNKN